MRNPLSTIVNYFFPVPASNLPATTQADTFNVAVNIDQSPKAIKKNLSNYIAPVQLQRIKQDFAEWRAACTEAELAYYPHRVRMQRMFLDTELNGHVFSCVDRRKDLTKLRKFEFYTGTDENAVVNKELTEAFTRYSWFDNFVDYSLDAIFHGYTLISLGGITDDAFKEIKVVKRWNISPDRHQVTGYIYSLSGIDWRKPPYKDWHVYVSTPNSTGISPCGYGLYYKVALLEILLRHILTFNADFVELYAQPYRVGKTNKTTESERAELERAIQSMGSSGYALIDPMDEIEFLETALGGTGWKGYDNFEARLQKIISKIILGHADALDSVPGKLGNDSEKSPAQQAMEDKQTKDGKFIETIVNEELLPRMMSLGFQLPEGIRFRYKNDAEKEEVKDKENKDNQAVAEIAVKMKNAGLQMSPEYFQERTGIPTTAVPEPAPIVEKGDIEKESPEEMKVKEKVKARLKMIYGS